VAVFAKGFREAHQAVETVGVLLGHDDRADAGEAFHQALGSKQVQCLADGVAGGAVVGGEGRLVGKRAVREPPGQELVAEQVGELACPVRTQPSPRTVGGDGGRALADVVSDTVRG